MVLALPAVAGVLTLFQVTEDEGGLAGSLAGAEAVSVSPDGEHVYVVSWYDDALTAFNRSTVSGFLSFREDYIDDEGGVFGLMGASSVATSPDGRHIYATGELDDTLVVFGRDATGDSETFVAAQVQQNQVGSVFGLAAPRAVAVSPDNEQVFVAASFDDSLAVFSRDASSDDLTFVEAELDSGFKGLEGASDVAVSPDSKHVYVTGEISDTVSVFARQGNGTVDFVATYGDGVLAEGLDGARGVAVSGDGLHVYTVGHVDDAVSHFTRDTVTGALTFVESWQDGVDGITGLAGASDIVINGAGDRVFVAATDADAVVVFRRTLSTGTLDFLEAVADPSNAVSRLRGVISLAVGPGDESLYAVSRYDDAINFFSIQPCLGNALSDGDGDAFCDDIDLCTGDDLVGDEDTDLVCDDLDACPGFDDTADSDMDAVPDGCDACQGDDASGDSDTDLVCDDLDACPGFDDSVDSDVDSVPDGCDLCLGDDATGDSDSDLVCDNLDVCAGFDDTADVDLDAVPDGCDLCQGDDATGDVDADAVCDDLDACPGFDDALDADGDLVPDGCDVCEGDDASGNSDGDLFCDANDCAPLDPLVSERDLCGVCGGDNTSCIYFEGGFEPSSPDDWVFVDQ